MTAELHGPSGPITLKNSQMYMGRYQESNEIVVPDNAAAERHHAVIAPHSSGPVYGITSSGTIPVFVNQQQLKLRQRRWLNRGDIIRIGNTIFTYQASPDARLERNGVPKRLGTSRQNIGRQPSNNNIVFPDSPKDTHYAVISPGHGEPVYGILALNRNRVFVNKEQLRFNQPYWLNHNDTIQIGRATFTYKASQQTNKASQQTNGAGFGAFIFIVIIIAIIIAAYYSQNQPTPSQSTPPPPTPQTTLAAFCNAVKSGNFQTAYDQLSSKAQKQESEKQFASQLKKTFTKQGGLKNCITGKVQQQKTTASSTIVYIFVKGKPIIYAVSLVDEKNTWKISSLKLHRT